MIRTPDEDLKRELQDIEYVKLYGASDCKAEIAVTLSTARQNAGKTQKELAESMNLSQPYIARLEGGEANPTIGTIGSILAMLGCRLITDTVSLVPEHTPLNMNTWPTVFISANDSGFGDLFGDYPSDRGFANDDQLLVGAVAAAGSLPQNEIEQQSNKILVGGTV